MSKFAFFFLCLKILASSCSNGVKVFVDDEKLKRVPSTEQVGANMLPDTIAPVLAPFDMPEFKKPVFPSYTIEVDTDMEGIITTKIQQAIDGVHAAGGGQVTIPAGNWRTGRIILKSNVNLHLEEGAELHFSGKIADYLPVVFTRNEGIEIMSLGACIYANGEENIAITGKGKLVGPEEGVLRARIMKHDVIENIVQLDKPVEERIYDGKTEDFIFPPMFISPINCKQVYIEGISLENTAFWNIVPIYCDGVIIRGVTVNSVGIQRGDGVNIESSRNVLIEYCTLYTGDDCFTMKAGRGTDGLRVNKPTENVVLRYALAEEGHGGITVGSETAGMIRNLYVHDCVFNNDGVGIRFKTRRPRGGGGEHLYYERLRMNVKHTALRWDMLGSAIHVGAAADRKTVVLVNKLTPHFNHIKMKDIIIESASQFAKIDGIPESPLVNVSINNLRCHSDKLFEATDAKNIQITNAYFKSQDTVISLLSSSDIRFENIGFEIPADQISIDTPAGDGNNFSLRQVRYY